MMTEVSGTLLRTKSKSDMTCQWKNSHAPFVPPSSSKHPLHYTYPKTDRLIPLQGAWNLPMPSKSNCQHKTCWRSTHAQVIVLPKWDANPPRPIWPRIDTPLCHGNGSTHACPFRIAYSTCANHAVCAAEQSTDTSFLVCFGFPRHPKRTSGTSHSLKLPIGGAVYKPTRSCNTGRHICNIVAVK